MKDILYFIDVDEIQDNLISVKLKMPGNFDT